MKFFMILGLVALGLGYYFRDDLPDWAGSNPNARLSVPSATSNLSRSVGGALGGAANRF